MSNDIDVSNHRRSKPYAARKAKKNATLEFDVMLEKMSRSLNRILEKDRLAGWPEDQATRIRESF